MAELAGSEEGCFVCLYVDIVVVFVMLCIYISCDNVNAKDDKVRGKALQRDQLSRKMELLKPSADGSVPPSGWIKAIRTALGMSMQQLGNRLGVTRQTIHDLEKRETDGAITIKSLRQVGKALDMELVYGFVPKDGTLDALIDRKARELAETIVRRTAQNMRLEEQANSDERIEKAISDRAADIKREMPKYLWD